MTAAPNVQMSAQPKLFAAPNVVVSRDEDGTIRMCSAVPLGPQARCVGDWLEAWATQTPNKVFLADRSHSDLPWRKFTYAETLRRVRAAGSWLLAHGLSVERPLVILSDNSADHAILMLAAMHVGVPVAAISPAYSLISKDYDKLKGVITLLNPGAIFVANLEPFATALAAIAPLHQAALVTGEADERDGAVPITSLFATSSDDTTETAFRAIGPDTIAKFLFTSGSTGSPKAVINTQRMLTSNQTAKAQVWPFLEDGSDFVILDWLPWSHTFGTNHNFNCVLRNGGTLYIDAGKPAPGLFSLSLANLREIVPTVYFNVPRGFEMLVSALRDDSELRHRFFSEVRIIFYAGAALPQNLWAQLEDMSLATVGHVVPIVSAWGSTETAPLATDCHFQAQRSGNVGVPIPGTEIKLVPVGGKLEVRVRGPNVTPGYWKAPELTAKAFDDEGFYMIGDAMAFTDADHPEDGLFFDGRISEDFKLLSGTWVNVGALRVNGVVALAPLAQDIVVAGHDRNEVAFLVFPNIAACRALGFCADNAPIVEVLRSPAVMVEIARGLAKLKAQGGGSSTFATRAVLLREPPSVDGGEITDKGYINQRAVLSRRAEDIARLYDDKSTDWIGCP